jgi:hypothetical protein
MAESFRHNRTSENLITGKKVTHPYKHTIEQKNKTLPIKSRMKIKIAKRNGKKLKP